MNDLKLNKDRETLKRILENVIPKTLQDVVLIYVSVIGKQNGELYEENYVQKIYPQTIAGKSWSAIQISTAAGLCAVVDLVLSEIDLYQGFVAQESFKLSAFQENRFGRFYRR
jgi:saccharopine dehydrogenase-like NADP-dependent oxidoreductase